MYSRYTVHSSRVSVRSRDTVGYQKRYWCGSPWILDANAHHCAEGCVEEKGTHHHCVDPRVDKDEHPNGWGHVAHASPHAHHGTGVVVGLERGAQLAFGQNDEGIEDLVELAEVEDPAIKGQALVPDAPRVGAARGSVACQRDIARIRCPVAFLRVVKDGISKACGTMKASHAVHEAIDALRRRRADHTTVHDADHTVERPRRVDRQKHIVGHHERVKEAGFADGPWLLAVGGVVDVQELRGDSVDGGNRQWHFGIEGGLVKVVRDQDWWRRGH